MNLEYIIDEDKVLEVNHDELDPNGNPIIIELTLEEYQNIINNK